MPTTITPLTLFFTSTSTPATNGGGATYTNVPIPSTLNGTPLTQNQRVLTYALAAELLEFQLYQQAYYYLTGQPLPFEVTSGTPNPPTVTDALGYIYGTGTGAVSLNVSPTGNAVASYLAEFAQIEYAHGQFLISALGGNPYTQPAGSAIEFAFGLHTLTTEVAVARAIYEAELTGVSAYTGAIPQFSSPTVGQTPSTLQIAASILGTEARHTTALAATINALNNGSPVIETAPQYNEGGPVTGSVTRHGTDVPLPPDDILNAGSGSINVPGVLLPSGASAGNNGGTLGPVSGPMGAAVGPANGTTTPTYNGFVYLVTTTA